MAAHKHAKLIADYAADAAETDKPWERWEYRSGAGWVDCDEYMAFRPDWEYRRKPQKKRDEGLAGFEKAQKHQEKLEKLRDKFAMAAMQGLVSEGETNTATNESIAVQSYAIADAMLEARK